MDEHRFLAETGDEGERIDRFLAIKLKDLTRSRIQVLAEEGNVFVGGKTVTKNHRLRAGEEVVVFVPPPEAAEAIPQNIPLTVIYEDADILVADKPKGMVVHPAPGNAAGTLVNALLFHTKGSLSGIGGVIRPGIVHRIDKDTSGLLVVAKNDMAHHSLSAQIAAHTVDRYYYCVVYGGFKELHGEVCLAIGRDRNDRKKMSHHTTAPKEAVTTFEVVTEYEGFTLLKCRLLTGRTHQIRVHMAAIGHPVAGDAVYGPKKVITELHGQCLHAAVLGFLHPRTGEHLLFESPLPEYFTNFLKKLHEKGE